MTTINMIINIKSKFNNNYKKITSNNLYTILFLFMISKTNDSKIKHVGHIIITNNKNISNGINQLNYILKSDMDLSTGTIHRANELSDNNLTHTNLQTTKNVK